MERQPLALRRLCVHSACAAGPLVSPSSVSSSVKSDPALDCLPELQGGHLAHCRCEESKRLWDCLRPARRGSVLGSSDAGPRMDLTD